MKLSQLRTFVAVRDTGSFSGASRVLNLAQPAVSKQVAQLERELGVALFIRAPGGVRLTEAGETFLLEAQQILELNDRAIARTRAAAQADDATLHLAYGELLREHETRLAAATVVLADREPLLRVVSHRLPSAEQWRELSEGRIDAGVGYGEPEGFPRLASEPLAHLSASSVFLPESHPLAGAPRLRFRDLAELPLLLFPRQVNPPLYDRILSALAERGLTPTVRTGMHLHAAREAEVSAGHGWLLAVGAAPEAPAGLVAREVEDPPIPTRLSLWWRADETEVRVLSFLDIARAAWES